jgi:hypothetical protein
MGQLDDFLADILPRQLEAERALHNGDAESRLKMWSRKDPVTVLGALGIAKTGSEELTNTPRGRRVEGRAPPWRHSWPRSDDPGGTWTVTVSR